MKDFLLPGIIVFLVALVVGIIAYTDTSEVAVETEKVSEPVLQHAHGFSVDTTNPDRLLIATHHGLLQFENSTLSQIGTVSDDFMGFTPHPTDVSVFFSSGHSSQGGNLGFQKSTDGGVTWKKVSGGLRGPVDFHSMTVSTVNPNLVYGFFGSLQHSKDGGQSWVEAKGKIQPYSLSSDPEREGVLYASTKNGVQVSEDNGDTWKSLSVELEGGEVSVFGIHPENKYALVFSEKLGGLGRSTDGGLTWERIAESFGGSPVLHIAYSKAKPSEVYVLTQSNTIYKSTDAGNSWTKVR